MKALSLDLRQRIAAALTGAVSHKNVAQRFAVSLSSVERIARKKREDTSLLPRASTGRKPKVRSEQRQAFERLAAARTDWTLQTLADAWHAQGGQALSPATVLRTLRHLKFSFKKSAA